MGRIGGAAARSRPAFPPTRAETTDEGAHRERPRPPVRPHAPHANRRIQPRRPRHRTQPARQRRPPGSTPRPSPSSGRRVAGPPPAPGAWTRRARRRLIVRRAPHPGHAPGCVPQRPARVTASGPITARWRNGHLTSLMSSRQRVRLPPAPSAPPNPIPAGAAHPHMSVPQNPHPARHRRLEHHPRPRRRRRRLPPDRDDGAPHRPARDGRREHPSRRAPRAQRLRVSPHRRPRRAAPRAEQRKPPSACGCPTRCCPTPTSP